MERIASKPEVIRAIWCSWSASQSEVSRAILLEDSPCCDVDKVRDVAVVLTLVPLHLAVGETVMLMAPPFYPY